ncbi:MAG TPA: DUF3263 domain-containing protein [Actinomycetota bacterium]
MTVSPQDDTGLAHGLDQRERDILDFERDWWRRAVPKERAIRDRFGLSSARYHQVLGGLLDRPEALAYDPMLVRRLRRMRETRRRKRSARRLGFEV